MLTITNTISFESLMNEFKKYISDDKDVLKYVYFDGENFIATDSYILLKVNKDVVTEIPSEITTGALYNPMTMKVIESDLHKYPNVSKSIPSYCNLNIILNGSLEEINMIIEDRNTMFIGEGVDNLYKFIAHDDYLEIRTLNNPKGKEPNMLSQYIMKHRTFTHSDGTQKIINLQAEYITSAFSTINKLSGLSNKDIQFKVIGSTSPLVIEQEDVFTVLIMPVRTF